MDRRATLVASLTEAPTDRDLEAIPQEVDWLEVRADLVGEIDSAWLRARFRGSLLYTIRSRFEGGRFEGSRERRRRRLCEAATTYDAVDLEAERDFAPELLAAIPPEKRWISWHGRAGDLAALRSRLDHLAATPAAFWKLVPQAERSGEELAVLDLVRSNRRPNVIAFAGGEAGAWTRLAALQLGGGHAYGSVTRTPAAPGQLTIRQLVDDYGLPTISRAEFLCGVVGRPVLGSLSPAIYNAAYRTIGLPGLFVPFEVPSFGDFWLEIVESDALRELGLPLVGLAVTAPYKEVALAVAGAASPLAQRLSSANTLIQRDGVWEAESTDGAGITGALAARGVECRSRRAAVVGCGGAGRAAAAALAMAGADVLLVNRGRERGERAARLLGLPLAPLAEFSPREFDLIVQATPIGRDSDSAPPFEIAELRPGTIVVDLVYGEEETAVVRAARAAGAVAIDGREVLLAQAIPQFRSMLGRELPAELTRARLGIGDR